MIKYYYHKVQKVYYAVEDNDFADIGIDESDCVEVSQEEYDQSFTN